MTERWVVDMTMAILYYTIQHISVFTVLLIYSNERIWNIELIWDQLRYLSKQPYSPTMRPTLGFRQASEMITTHSLMPWHYSNSIPWITLRSSISIQAVFSPEFSQGVVGGCVLGGVTNHIMSKCQSLDALPTWRSKGIVRWRPLNLSA